MTMRCVAALLVGAVVGTSGTSVSVTPHGGVQPTGTSRLRLTLLADKVPAWPDVADAKLLHPPRFLEGLPLTVPGWQVPVGTEVAFTCPDSPAINVCDAWVFFYSCARSCATKYQGGLPGLLALSGWERTQCAPAFTTGAAGMSYENPMQAMRTQLPRGATLSYTLPGPEAAEFVVFGINANGVECGQWDDNEAGCTGAGDSCKWVADAPTGGQVGRGQCKLNDCRRQTVGPVPGCPECAWQGVVSPDRVGDGPFQLQSQPQGR